jgi:hypothetical protein
VKDGQVFHIKLNPNLPLEVRFQKIVRILVDLIEDGMRDQIVRQKAIEIVNAAGVMGHDEIGEVRAITKWVQTHMVYRKEPIGIEYFHTARRLLRDIENGVSAGDCDDFVILGGSLLGALGYPVGALIVDSSGDGVFNHVMLVTKTFSPSREFGDKWIPVELIYPEFELGQSVPVSRVYPLMAEAKHFDGPVAKRSIRGVDGIGALISKHPFGKSLSGVRRKK